MLSGFQHLYPVGAVFFTEFSLTTSCDVSAPIGPNGAGYSLGGHQSAQQARQHKYIVTNIRISASFGTNAQHYVCICSHYPPLFKFIVCGVCEDAIPQPSLTSKDQLSLLRWSSSPLGVNHIPFAYIDMYAVANHTHPPECQKVPYAHHVRTGVGAGAMLGWRRYDSHDRWNQPKACGLFLSLPTSPPTFLWLPIRP